jgi:hypothetical protein
MSMVFSVVDDQQIVTHIPEVNNQGDTTMKGNPFRAWLMEQPRAVTMASLARDLSLDPSYVSDLMSETNTMMPSLIVAMKIEKRTKGEVTARKLHDFAMLNRVNEDEVA